jgi:maleylacetate reductase
VTSFALEALPQRIVFGVGAVAGVPDEVDRLGLHRVMLIAGGSAKPAGDDVAERLGVRVAGRWSEVRQHVPEALAAHARAAAAEAGADGVLTVGGGSATGLGKAVTVHTGLPLVAVPTTYAGSEATPFWGITGERKRTGRDPRVLPRTVVYDPALTTGLPARATGTTGFNALAHCVEALYAPRANPVTALLAEAGLRRLARALPAAVAAPDDLAARSDALLGAYLAGAALGTAGTALHHTICHVLGGSFGLVHGEANAVLLPHVVALNGAAAPDMARAVAGALGAEEPAAGLRALAERLGLPTSLAAIGMPRDGLDAAAEQAVAAVGDRNPRPVDVPTVRRMLDDAYAGRPPATGTPNEGRAP